MEADRALADSGTRLEPLLSAATLTTGVDERQACLRNSRTIASGDRGGLVVDTAYVRVALRVVVISQAASEAEWVSVRDGRLSRPAGGHAAARGWSSLARVCNGAYRDITAVRAEWETPR